MSEQAPAEIARVLAGWDGVVQASARSSRSARRLARFLAVSLLFDVLFTLGLGYGVNQRCQSANDFRRQDRARWEYVITLSTPSGQRKSPTVRRFEQYLKKEDAPQPCAPW